MPYKTVMKRFTDGVNSWMEPEQVWVDPTPEEEAAEKAEAERQAMFKAKFDELAKRANDLSSEIQDFLDKK